MKRLLLGILFVTTVGVIGVGCQHHSRQSPTAHVELPEHAALLTVYDTIVQGQSMYYASVLTTDSQRYCSPLITRQEWQKLLFRPSRIYTIHNIGAHKQLFDQLRELLRTNVPENDTVYTLLMGEAANLAVEAIPINEERYLCDVYCFKRISSVNLIARHTSDLTPTCFQNVALFGDIDYKNPQFKNLRGSRNAIAYLRELFGEQSLSPDIYAQEMATKEAFKDLSGKGMDNILISTHGEVRMQENESDAYELLFDESRGVPTYEIAKMDLSGILTLLTTACHSGRYMEQEERCLRTVLKKAGANTIISHIWQTNDRAAEIFMKTYYTVWLSGQSPREAFRSAQNAIRAKMEEPDYWAGFVMLD